LIDLTTDGWALSNSKTAIPATSKGHDPPGAEIFYETAGLQQNTVNTGFLAYRDAENACQALYSRAPQFD
jgi:hypothetical protein